MSGNAAKKNDLSYYINSAIVILLMFVVPLFEPFGQVTEAGMRVLGVFMGMLWGWLTVGFVWPSLLGIVMISFSGLTNISSALTSGFGNVNLVIYSILGFMFATYLDKCELTGAIASFFMTKKIFDGKPYVLVGIIFALAFTLGAMVAIFAGIFITWAILYKVIDLCEYKHNTAKVTYLVAMVPMAAVLGMMFPPFHAIAIMYTGLVAGAIGGTFGTALSYAGWMGFMLIAAIVMMLAYIAVGKYIFRFDFSLMANTEHFAYLKTGKMTFEQKFGLADLILVIAILLSPEFLPAGALSTTLKALGVGGAFLIGIMIPIIYKRNGASLCNIKDCMDGVSWDVIWMLIATGPVSAAMQSADSGIIATLVGSLTTAFGGLGWVSFTLITGLILGLATQVTHNVIIAIVLFGPFATVCANLGGDPIIWFMFNFYLNMAAFMTPAASVNSALVFGNTEWVDQKSTYLFGTVWFIINYAVVALLLFTIGGVFF